MTKRPLTPNEYKLWRYVAQQGFSASYDDHLELSPIVKRKHTGQFNADILKRLAEGKITFSGKIDLHGYSLEAAHTHLYNYLRDIQLLGGGYVLVVTGKGKIDFDVFPDDHRGTLKLMVPRWLSAKPFEDVVVDVATAHICHGGQGALYVKLLQIK